MKIKKSNSELFCSFKKALTASTEDFIRERIKLAALDDNVSTDEIVRLANKKDRQVSADWHRRFEELYQQYVTRFDTADVRDAFDLLATGSPRFYSGYWRQELSAADHCRSSVIRQTPQELYCGRDGISLQTEDGKILLLRDGKIIYSRAKSLDGYLRGCRAHFIGDPRPEIYHFWIDIDKKTIEVDDFCYGAEHNVVFVAGRLKGKNVLYKIR